MRLHGFPISNYYNKVKIALLEKGVPFEEAHLYPSQKEPVLRISPMGKVPALELDDGTTIAESGVIVEYLEDAYPEPALLPRDPVARAKVRELVAVLDWHIEIQARQLYREAFFSGTASDEVKATVERELQKGIRALKQIARWSPYIGGPDFTLADCAAIVHLPLVTLATRKIYGRDFLEELDLKPYLKLCGERASVRKTNDDRKAAQEAAAKK